MLAWIIENTVMASGLALLVGLVCRFNRTRPALCHLMWLMVFVVLVLPPIPLGSFGPGLNLRQGISDWIEPEMVIDEAEEEAIPGVKELVEGAPLELVERETSEDQEPIAGAVAPRESGGGGLGAWITSIPLVTWLILAWALGAIVMAGRLQLRILAFHRNVRSAPSAPRSLRRAVFQVARRLGIRAPEVRLISGVGCPSVWCFGRPRLLWPRGRAEHLDSGCEPSLIAHELAHLARRDHWVSRLEVLVMGLLWWNPLFWVIRAQVHYYSELSCDAWALWAYPTDRRAYAEALIDAQEKTLVAPVALHGLCATDTEFKDFERRLSMIMKKKVSRGVSKGTAALAILTTLLMLPAFADDVKKAPKGEGKAVAEMECFEGLITAKKLYGKAEKLFADKQYEKALDVYAKVLALDPENGMAHSRAGYILVALGEYGKGAKHYKKELALGHNPPTATYNLACAASMMGKTDAALGYLEKAVRCGFDNTKLMAKDTDLDAIRETEAFNQSLKLATYGAELRKKMDIAKKSGDKDAALDLLSQLTDVYSEDGSLHHSFGLSLLAAGYLEDAAQAFQRQAETGYLQGNAYYNVACALARSGDDEGALKSLKHAAKVGMSYAGVLSDTDLKSLHGDPRFDELKKIIAAPAIRTKKIESALKKGDVAMAQEKLVELLKNPKCSDKERGWASYQLATIQLKNDQYEHSIANFEKAAKIGYSIQDAAFHIGVANAAMGNQQKALMLLKQSLELGFANPEMMIKVAKQWNVADKETMSGMIQRAEKNSKSKALELKKKQLKAGEAKKKKVGATAMK